MGAGVVHILQSRIPHADTVAVCLSDLVDALSSAGLESIIVDTPASFSSVATAKLIHIHGWGYPLARAAAQKSRHQAVPFVISPIGALTPFPPSGLWRRLRNFVTQRPLIRAAAALIATNEAEERALAEAKVHPCVVTLPYGFRFSTATQAALPNTTSEQRKNLLVLGPLDPPSGCAAALKALAELGPAADGWTITLAGSDTGEWRPQLEAAVRRKGAEDRVRFADPMTVEHQRELLLQADLLLAPSMRISPAISVMQALESAIPVVATRNASPPGINGELTVCGPTRQEIRSGLRQALELTPQQRAQRAQAARKQAAALYDWSVLAPRYAELYRSCMSAHGKTIC